jgi:threonine dehydrogenase-like Zn-dependent dehydrogenase
MRATVFRGPFDVRIEQVRDAVLHEPTAAVVRITHAAICASDLWPYRGLEPFPPGGRLGHEWMGMVEGVGSMVSTIKRGDRVIAPFAFSDGTCEFCHKGLYTNCLHGGVWGQAHDGGQAEAIRAPFADSTLVVVPSSVEGDEARLRAILPLTDVMATGHYAALLAGVHPGGTVAIVGDGDSRCHRPSRRKHRLRRGAPWHRTDQSDAALFWPYSPTRWGGLTRVGFSLVLPEKGHEEERRSE